MVTYYGQAAMYRAQQQMSAPNGHFQGGAAMPAWYAGYHHQGAQLPAAPASYCMQEDQQMWHPHGAHAHNLFQHDFQEFMHAGMPAVQQQPQVATDPANQLPSPTITVSGSDPSSPGCQSGGTLSPPQNPQARPPPARSPYEWIKKTSYQSQPIPGKTRTKDKYRVVYTDHQRIELEKEFTFNNKYITIRRKSELAANLGLSERQIKIWFQNRRAKERKQSKKRAEERTQADMVNNTGFAQNVMSHPQVQQQHMDMHNQTQNVLSNIVPPTSAVLQRYMESNHPMKLENPESDQLG